MTGTSVTRGSARGFNLYAMTLSPAQVAANTTAEQTFVLKFPGLATTDYVYVTKPSNQAGLGIVNCRVSAANTLAISFINCTGSPITPTAGEIYLLTHVVSEYQPLQTTL